MGTTIIFCPPVEEAVEKKRKTSRDRSSEGRR
jgi:hypothetical protein